jgi:hypothetical protein
MRNPRIITMVLNQRGECAQWLDPHNLFSGKKELIQSRVSRSSAIAAFSPGVAFVSGSCDLLVAEPFLLDFMARTLSPWASGLVLETSCGAVRK